MFAAMRGNTEVVSLLLKAGANTDLQKRVGIHERRCGLGSMSY